MNHENSENGGEGIIYILTNAAMPGYIKIGKTTTSIEQRMLELSRSSAIPLPFECYYAARVSSVQQVENAFHDAFGDHRINPKREFFAISPERVVAVLKLLAVEEVTLSHNAGIESKEDMTAIEKARKKRSAFNFEMVGIPVGAELQFTRNRAITCVVAPDQKRVIYQGETISLSLAAQKALGYTYGVQGSVYWTYDGEILDEMRTRMTESGGEPMAGDYISQIS